LTGPSEQSFVLGVLGLDLRALAQDAGEKGYLPWDRRLGLLLLKLASRPTGRIIGRRGEMMQFAQGLHLFIDPLARLGQQFFDLGTLLSLRDVRQVVVKRLAVCVQVLYCPVVFDANGCTNGDLPRLSSRS
jgi:hypothetical protein